MFSDKLISEMTSLSNLVQPADEPLKAKLPAFLKADPALWIEPVDAHFEFLRVSSQRARFFYTSAAIEEPLIYELRDILMNPPEDDPYDALRDAILSRFSASEQQRLRQLIAGESLGDRTPSQFLRHLQQLLGEASERFNAALMREFFLRRLPPDVQLVLSSCESSVPLSSLVTMTDRMVERMGLSANAVNSLPKSERETNSPPQGAYCTAADLNSLRAEIQALRSELLALKVHLITRRSRSRDRSFSRERCERSGSHLRDDINADGLCFYHARFGDKAAKCKEGCRRNPKVSPNP